MITADMQKFLALLLIPFFLGASIEPQTLQQIGLKVWQNECRGTLSGLVTWNATESFPSLGIGHFIWHPEGTQSAFEETFPALIEFLADRLKETDIKIPSWIRSKRGCPWRSRAAFLKDERSARMQQLRDLLSSTIDLQFLFLVERFKHAEAEILPVLTSSQTSHLKTLKSSPQGVYALIDYVNFKGWGLNKKERYRGEGWGLLQVLQNMPETTPQNAPIAAFVTSAKQVLNRRVKNAPAHHKEGQYLKGWFKRLETYQLFDSTLHHF